MEAKRPLFVQKVRAEHPKQNVEVWFQDESRFGQQGTLTRVWAQRGSRPTCVKQTECKWVYLFGAANPQTGASVAMIAPTVSTHLMNAPLRMIAEPVGEDVHVVLVLDNAGGHVAKALHVPSNITLLRLAPYSPELNPMERLWCWLKEPLLSHRIYADYDTLFTASGDAWNTLTPERISSVCHTTWIERMD